MTRSSLPRTGAFFLAGIKCFFKGISTFYSDKSLWKYGAIPMLLMIFAYILFLAAAVITAGFLSAKLEACLPALPVWLQWLNILLSLCFMAAAFLIAGILAVFTATTVFEIFAGPFFDRLILVYEYKTRDLELTELNFRETLQQIWISCRYSLGTLGLLILLTLAALVIPLIGPLLLVLVSSYRLGVTYMMPAGFLHRQREYLPPRAALLSFGLLTYGLFLLPLLPVLFIPGVILGGCELFHLRPQDQ